MTVKAFAPAKINLTLHVTGQREDGYHLLDSLVVFADVGDRLTLTPGHQLSLDVSGEFSGGVPADGRNLVWKAAQGIGWTGHIRLEKVLPHGGGLGGGSSDAASVLKAITAQGVAIPEALPLSLGADVPVCLMAQAARMEGIGERLTPANLPTLPALLINPGVEVPTGAVFSALAGRAKPAMVQDLPQFDTIEDCAGWLSAQRNDLEQPAIKISGEIEQTLDALGATRDVLLTRMSGSGSTCFALYPTMKAAHFAAYEIGAAHPNWWCRAVRLN